MRAGKRPAPRRQQPRKPVFSARGWALWLSQQPHASPSPDEREINTRADLEEFRQRVVIGK